MKIVICWSHVSGYMVACWRALAARPGIDLHVIAFAPEGDAAFDTSIVDGLHCELINSTQREDADYITARVIEAKPDAIVIPGWLSPAYCALTRQKDLAGVRFIMGIDTPFDGSWRQRLGRIKVGRLIDQMDLVVVAGERAFQLAKQLGVPERKILRGVYGYDDPPMRDVFEHRNGIWPRAFLYVGRYVTEKGIADLSAGYAEYRRQVSDPWPLRTCGKGVEVSSEFVNLGFIQPRDLPKILGNHGVFVLASRFEPWGVALAEAMASGMPVICTEACGASVDLVRHLWNGLIVPTADPQAIAQAMQWMHENVEQLPQMGERARQFAMAYSAGQWARRWGDRITRL